VRRQAAGCRTEYENKDYRRNRLAGSHVILRCNS
jgi:hypothetical protein